MIPFPVNPEKDTVCKVIRRWAEVQPDAATLLDEDKSIVTYAALAAHIDRTRERLLEAGYGLGDRVAIAHPGAMDTALLTLGVMDGPSAVPLNPSLNEEETSYLFNSCRVDGVIIERGMDFTARQVAERHGVPILEVEPEKTAFTISNVLQPRDKAAKPSPEPSSAGDVGLVLTTSGTTSQRKIVPITHRQILARSASTSDFLEMQPDDRCINLLAMFLHGGFANMAAGLYSGGSVIFLRTFSFEAFFQYLLSLAPTFYVASYTHNIDILKHAVESGFDAAEANLRFIRTTSGAIDSRVVQQVEEVFGVPVIEAYSSTETGRIAGNPRPPGIRKLGAVGLTTGGEVAIMADDGTHLPPFQIGEVIVRGENVFDGYENDAEANAASFVDGWFRTGDEGYFDKDSYLHLTGRIKETINRGGEKVSPAEVDTALLSHPDVIEAATFSLRHPTLGEEVAAAVVQAPGAGLTDQILTKYLLGRLSGFKVPRRFYFVPEIPRSDAGKLQRFKLPELLAIGEEVGTHTATTSDREPSPLEAQLQGIWAQALGIRKVGLYDNFFMLGGDSLQAVDLFLAVEKELGRCLPRSILFAAGTVAEMARRIEDFSPSPCLVPIQPKGDRPPFFCVHDGNGEVLNYRELARLLGETQPFYGIQCRGLDREGVPFTRIEDMAAHYVQEMRRVQPAGPYYVGGYSFGGRVAYVMAQQLRAAGEEVALLALLDTASGYGQRRVGWTDWLAHHRERLKDLRLTELPGYLGLRAANLTAMVGRNIRIRFFSMAWRYFERTNRTVPRFMRRPVPANDMIRRTYKAQPYDGGATLFRAEPYAWAHPESREGWKELIKGNLEIRPISGRHYEIVHQPHVQNLAAELKDALKRAQSSAPARIKVPAE